GSVPSAPGFGTREELTGQYARITGRDLSRIGYYMAFGCFKLAVVLEGIHARFLQRKTVGEGFEREGPAVPVLIERAHQLLDADRGRSRRIGRKDHRAAVDSSLAPGPPYDPGGIEGARRPALAGPHPCRASPARSCTRARRPALAGPSSPTGSVIRREPFEARRPALAGPHPCWASGPA